MQFAINLNQEKLANTNLDITEAAILDYLYHYCSSVSPKVEKNRLVDDSGVWTWIDLKQLALDMPLLRINDSTALSRRIPNIEKEGFIAKKYGAGKRLYVKITERCDSLYRKSEMTTITSEMTDIITESKKTEPEMTDIISRNDGYHFSIHNSNTSTHKTITSKTGLVACTAEELQEIAKDLNVDLTAVKRTHDIILDKISAKEFKGKTVYLSLRNWIRMGMERGTIKELPVIKKNEVIVGGVVYNVVNGEGIE